jgi:hypothetical protein
MNNDGVPTKKATIQMAFCHPDGGTSPGEPK